jgi:hypothetical protein
MFRSHTHTCTRGSTTPHAGSHSRLFLDNASTQPDPIDDCRARHVIDSADDELEFDPSLTRSNFALNHIDLLGLHAAHFQADHLHASLTEMVCAEPHLLPGDFCNFFETPQQPASARLNLRTRAAELQSAPANGQSSPVLSTTHPSLDDNLSPLLHCHPVKTTFSMQPNITHRLKPCYSDSEPAPLAAPPEPTPLPTPRPSTSRRVRFADEQPSDHTLRTRSGRCSAPPKRLGLLTSSLRRGLMWRSH